MNKKLNKICEFRGGSHLYGLNTPASDIDYRFVFLNTELSDILGLSKFEHQVHQDETQDVSGKEVRHFFKLLRNGNTEALEALWGPESSFSLLTSEWKLITTNRDSFMDSDKIFRCLIGYSYGELKLANGERTGKLGSKRKNSIDEFGFSPKNFTNLFRLLITGINYFKTGEYLVDFRNTKNFDFLLKLKTQPQDFKKEELNTLAKEYENLLKKTFDKSKIRSKFNENLANDIILTLYKESLDKFYNKRNI